MNTLPSKKIGAEPGTDRLFVLSVGKCFQLLECLNAAKRPLTLTELIQLSGLEKSAVQRFAHTLRELGYLRQHAQTRAYSLSSRMLEFGHTVLTTDSVKEVADRHLLRLNQQCRETVNLMELEGREIVYVSRYPSIHPVSVNLHVGSRLPAFCTAAGRAMLAFLPACRAQSILDGPRPAMTQHTVTGLDELLALLEQVRQDGYVINNQEAFIGDISVAAPIMNAEGDVVGAVNIAVPSPRWSLDKAREDLVPQVLDCARAIRRDLA
ncbi:MAG TPA: IclR family transcriptional regulator [Bordetella sp.]|nr:IclR family transcriptional regulator [Bordetella sp.]